MIPPIEYISLAFPTLPLTFPLFTQLFIVSESLNTEPIIPPNLILTLALEVRVMFALFVMFEKVPPLALPTTTPADAPLSRAVISVSETVTFPFTVRFLISLCMPSTEEPPGSSEIRGLFVVTVYPNPSMASHAAELSPPARVLKFTPGAVRSIFAVR